MTDCVAAAARRMYDAEFALHAARQSAVESWIVAASAKLHTAILAHTVALYGPADLTHPSAA